MWYDILDVFTCPESSWSFRESLNLVLYDFVDIRRVISGKSGDFFRKNPGSCLNKGRRHK